MVNLLRLTFQATDAIERRTSDADAAISLQIAADGRMHERLLGLGYTAESGNRYVFQGRTIDLLIPVSYTHLDVYKRQEGMRNIFVINAGSSSIKYQLLDGEAGLRLTTGLVERIGEDLGRVRHESGGRSFEWEAEIADHSAAFEQMARGFAAAGTPLDSLDIAVVGHRVVQGLSLIHI